METETHKTHPRPDDKAHDLDDPKGVGTTGHEWDGIRELNNPMPRWWLNTFYVCIIWAVGYMAFYPAIPFVGADGYSEGLLGQSDRMTVASELVAAKQEQGSFIQKIDATSLDDIMADQDLLTFARRGGRAAFGDNCAGCHGTAAEGAQSFPNLLDDDWLWGGSLTDIYQTIEHGIRWDADYDTRLSAMPAFLSDGILARAEVLAVAEFVRSLSGEEHDTARAREGAAIFADQCAACHGEQGEGTRTLGAPRLNDAVWLFGGDQQALFETIAYSRAGVMPAWNERLEPVTMKQLAIYVHGLGGGE